MGSREELGSSGAKAARFEQSAFVEKDDGLIKVDQRWPDEIFLADEFSPALARTIREIGATFIQLAYAMASFAWHFASSYPIPSF